ncbi:MAG: hypothetical protein OSB00_18840, partial [Sphingomonas bacterium]|nr:hypothetical protein [Sphingomonas bacterium]
MSDIAAWLFGADHHVTTAQQCARTALVFGYGLALIRVAGRRLFGKWSAVDITVSIVIGSNLSRTITGNAPLLGTLVASTLLVLLHWIVASLATRSRWWSWLFEGSPIDLVRNGTINETMRRRHNVSYADLDEAL